MADLYYGGYGGHIKHKEWCEIGRNAREWIDKRTYIKTSALI